MGFTSYSSLDRGIRAEANAFYTAPVEQTFKSRSLHKSMDPKGLVVRESRDSEAHPKSVAIIIGLDVTGSMLSVPADMVKDGLPTIMTSIIQAGEPDPQVLFLGIGDHVYDEAPLQVGQFESGDEELDDWLTKTWLEKGGGANAGESYMLAWYLAAKHTSIDCYEKRNQKGFLFTIGDEPILPSIPASSLAGIMGDGQYGNYTSKQLLEEAQKMYNVFHIHTTETGAGRQIGVIDGWRELLGQNVLVVDHHSKIPALIASTVVVNQGTENFGDPLESGSTEGVDNSDDVKML